MGDPQRYRTREEVEAAREKDPVEAWRRALLDGGLATEAELSAVRDGVEADVEAAVRFAEASPVPDPSGIDRHVLVEG
jgi:pyruvate dehydrogenase E1 component alpha subunit